eukprot:6419172-Pyramimonas_sp.AAC.1
MRPPGSPSTTISPRTTSATAARWSTSTSSTSASIARWSSAICALPTTTAYAAGNVEESVPAAARAAP